MKRNPDSIRSIKWIERNSLNNPSCRKYVEVLLTNKFKISTYKFCEFDTEEIALWITYGLFSYILEADKDNICIKILEKDAIGAKDKYHLSKKVFYGDTCWYDCISWIVERLTK